MSGIDLTLSAAWPKQPPETTITTNAEFLAGVFAGLPADERPIVVGVMGKIDAATKWPPGTPWWPGKAAPGRDRAADELNWYFTLSTYTPVNGQYRRRKQQFARAWGVMLDDIGTKAAPLSRLEALPPSYVIETSPGNHQAGYLFDAPCSDIKRVEALQDALAAAGLCDPGAKGPSARVGRLPVGINGKYNPPPRCRLVEFHPDRRYSIDQIVEGLELAPPVKGERIKKPKATRPPAQAVARDEEADVYLPRATENAVLSALRQRGLYKQPLGSGRHDITCPWVHEHTGQIDHGSAYFEPSDLYPLGGFKCQHSHGESKRVGALLSFLGVSTTEAKHKPTIRVTAGELHRVVDAAERELAAAGRHYQRGGLVVTVSTDPGTGETSIKPVSLNALTRALSSCVTWERFDGRKNDFVVTDPPARHAGVLFDADAYVHLPALRGIARQPYLRADGSLVTTSGFDAVTGMFGVFDERHFKVPTSPTRADAVAALAELTALLTEFSFAAVHDQVAALALMLTAAIRPALPVAPMFHIRAPQIASGKSYLSGLGAAFASPSRPAAYAFPSNEEECAKLLLSALMESPAVITFDNLTSDLIPFKTLCSALTEEHLTGRLLGFSKVVTVPTAALLLSSGNNVDPVRDMARRVVTINLDPACETPATRRFNGDPLGLVRQCRGRYVSLALTIVRAYVVAGYPRQDLKPLGSYGDWTRLVRAPLAWLGLPDAAKTVFDSMASDPDRETLGRLMVAWRLAFAGSPTPVRDVVGLAESAFGSGHKDLCEVVRDVAEQRGQINRHRLGRWIARHQGRIVGGLKFERDSAKAGGVERWKVVMVVSGVTFGQAAESVTAEAPAFS